MSDPNFEAIQKIYKLKKLLDVLTVSGDKIQEKSERDTVDNDFIAMFQKDKKESLTAMFQYLSGSAEEPPRKRHGTEEEEEEIKQHITEIMQIHIAELIEKCLKNVTKEELEKLAKFVEKLADFDAKKFDVSNTDHVVKLISCMQMAVPFYAGGAKNIKFLEFVNRHKILLDFNKLPEKRKLDFLRALAEISAHATAKVAAEMLPSTIELLKKYMLDEKIKKEDIEKNMDYVYVECLQYILHRLLYHCYKSRVDTTQQLDNKDFTLRLQWVERNTWARIYKLKHTYPEHDKKVREART